MTYQLPSHDRKCEICGNMFLASKEDGMKNQWKCKECRKEKKQMVNAPQGFSAQQGMRGRRMF